MCVYNLEFMRGEVEDYIAQRRAAVALENDKEKVTKIRAMQDVDADVLSANRKFNRIKALIRMWEDARDAAKKFMNDKF